MDTKAGKTLFIITLLFSFIFIHIQSSIAHASLASPSISNAIKEKKHLSVGYATHVSGSLASSFGHVFLVFHNDKPKLTDPVINFAADTHNVNTFEKIAGGFDYRFDLMVKQVSLYEKILEYSHSQERNIYLFQLGISIEELQNIVHEITEFSSSENNRYHYTTNNCSSIINNILRNQKILSSKIPLKSKAIQTPQELIRNINKEGKIATVRLIESDSANFDNYYLNLDQVEKTELRSLLTRYENNKLPPLQDIPPKLTKGLITYHALRAGSATAPNSKIQTEFAKYLMSSNVPFRLEGEIISSNIETSPAHNSGILTFSVGRTLDNYYEKNNRIGISLGNLSNALPNHLSLGEEIAPISVNIIGENNNWKIYNLQLLKTANYRDFNLATKRKSWLFELGYQNKRYPHAYNLASVYGKFELGISTTGPTQNTRFSLTNFVGLSTEKSSSIHYGPAIHAHLKIKQQMNCGLTINYDTNDGISTNQANCSFNLHKLFNLNSTYIGHEEKPNMLFISISKSF